MDIRVLCRRSWMLFDCPCCECDLSLDIAASVLQHFIYSLRILLHPIVGVLDDTDSRQTVFCGLMNKVLRHGSTWR
jgi:hypothetical protein